MKTDTIIDLPQSVLVKNQKRTYGPRTYTEGGRRYSITATVRYDDQCGNGHNSFAITADIDDITGGRRRDYMGGCCHEEVAKHFPELAPLIKWHLFDSTGPMHYIANTIYHAGDRDHWGLRKGEFRQHTSRGKHQADGVEGVPHWELKIEGLPEKRDIYATEKPADLALTARWVPSGITGEGKERQLDSARNSAVWPDATDEQLCAEPEELKRMLVERLPALVSEFKAAVESLGFVY